MIYRPINDPVFKEYQRLEKERIEAEKLADANPGNQKLYEDALKKHKAWQEYLQKHLEEICASEIYRLGK